MRGRQKHVKNNLYSFSKYSICGKIIVITTSGGVFYQGKGDLCSFFQICGQLGDKKIGQERLGICVGRQICSGARERRAHLSQNTGLSRKEMVCARPLMIRSVRAWNLHITTYLSPGLRCTSVSCKLDWTTGSQGPGERDPLGPTVSFLKSNLISSFT
jgi:hypothetical protein